MFIYVYIDKAADFDILDIVILGTRLINELDLPLNILNKSLLLTRRFKKIKKLRSKGTCLPSAETGVKRHFFVSLIHVETLSA